MIDSSYLTVSPSLWFENWKFPLTQLRLGSAFASPSLRNPLPQGEGKVSVVSPVPLLQGERVRVRGVR